MQISSGLIVIVIAAAFLMWIIASFNGLVALRNRVRNAWAEIDVQL
jgi:LemA protein